jgi:hypothetical protein
VRESPVASDNTNSREEGTKSHPGLLNLVDLASEPRTAESPKIRLAQAGSVTDAPSIPAIAKSENAGTASMDATRAKIIDALNGTGDHPLPMNIPPEIRQLTVVTTMDWDDKHGQLHMFERDGKDKPWHSSNFDIPINVGEKGMGWGAGGLIHKLEPLTVNGQVESVGGPVLSTDSAGKPACDNAGNAKCEGDKRTTAGLFRLGMVWGTGDSRMQGGTDEPLKTSIPFRPLDADYPVVPKDGEQLSDQEGRSLNGKIVREINPNDLTYEQYENGAFQLGTLSQNTVEKLNRATTDPSTHYRWVHKDVQDEQGHSLTEKLVHIHASDPSESDPLHSAFENIDSASFLIGADGKQLAFNSGGYDGIDPKTGERLSGTLTKKAVQAISDDSDYKWGGLPDKGHKMSLDSQGRPQYSTEADDNLNNHPLRIIDRSTGEYEHLDPATGKPFGRGVMDQNVMHQLINEDEDMNDLHYRYAINILQNTNQLPEGGGDIFIHPESYLRAKDGAPDDTLGCVSMSVANLKKYIGRLETEKEPSILITPLFELDTLRQALK